MDNELDYHVMIYYSEIFNFDMFNLLQMPDEVLKEWYEECDKRVKDEIRYRINYGIETAPSFRYLSWYDFAKDTLLGREVPFR